MSESNHLTSDQCDDLLDQSEILATTADKIEAIADVLGDVQFDGSASQLSAVAVELLRVSAALRDLWDAATGAPEEGRAQL